MWVGPCFLRRTSTGIMPSRDGLYYQTSEQLKISLGNPNQSRFSTYEILLCIFCMSAYWNAQSKVRHLHVGKTTTNLGRG